MNFVYLAALVVSLASMILIDKKYSLAFFHDARRAGVTVAVGLMLFILWDIAGIVSGVFYSGQSSYMSGIYLAPEFPVEELLFLTFLCYFTLIVYRFGESKC